MAGKGLKDVTALNKCHSLRDTSQCARPTRRNMGVYIESCTEEEEEREGGRNHESRQRGRCIGSMGNERNGGLVLYRWIWREISCVA